MTGKICRYRIRQYAFSRVLRLTEGTRPQMVTGSGSLMRLPELLTGQGIQRVLLVTTKGFVRRGVVPSLLKALEKEGITGICFDQVMPDPEMVCVEEGVFCYRRENCQAIAALGGGSVIDCAKAIGARLARPDRTIPQMKGVLKVIKKIPPLYAIPTTAGTGSEVTAAAVVTDMRNGTHYKYAVSDPVLIPHTAILDPALTVGLSGEMTAQTGMDALTHAIEAYTNLFPSRYVRKTAVSAVQMIFENLPVVYRDGSNLRAREKMLLASAYAGSAFTNNFVGYVHALAHAVGAMYGIPHGKANAVILPYVLKAYGSAVYASLGRLADSIGITGKDKEEKAKKFIAAIEQLRDDLGIPSGFIELRKEDFPELIARAMEEANPAYPVPVIWEKETFLQVLEALEKGRK